MIAWIGMMAGCELEDPGGSAIAVGNPPTSTLRVALAVPGDGVLFDALELPISGVYVESCDGLGEVIPLSATVGLRGTEIPMRTGTWCALGLVPVDQTELSGAAGEGTFVFSSTLPRILLYGDAIVFEPDTAFVLELAEPAWIDAAAFGLAPGEHREIGGERCSADPLCARILTAMTDEAGLYDDDGDGAVDEAERDRGERATGSGRREP